MLTVVQGHIDGLGLSSVELEGLNPISMTMPNKVTHSTELINAVLVSTPETNSIGYSYLSSHV